MTETQVLESFQKWRKENAPPGARIDVTTHGETVVDIEICCAGIDSLMCYWCCLEPGHAGSCYSRHKSTSFQGEGWMPLKVPVEVEPPVELLAFLRAVPPKRKK